MPINQHEFARREMSRCGWTEGKGLGRSENGMKDAIKVKRKNNTNGLGHDQGTDFTFHWWDHIFNKAANSFKVSEGDGGDLIEKCEGKKIMPVLISNKRPLSSKFANASLTYGTFVKAGTYQAGKVSDVDSCNDSSDDSSDEDDDETLSVNDTLERTFKKTGLTGHKAARHGFGLCGKLQRLENQEQKQKDGKTDLIKDESENIVNKNTNCDNDNKCDDLSKSEDVISNLETSDHVKTKKKKKKIKEIDIIVDPAIPKDADCEQNNNKTKEGNTELCDQESNNTKTKKKKKKKKNLGSEEMKLQEDSSNKEINDQYPGKNELQIDGFRRSDDNTLIKKKKKKKRKHVEEVEEVVSEIENIVEVKYPKCKSLGTNLSNTTDGTEGEPKKKKKKKKKEYEEISC